MNVHASISIDSGMTVDTLIKVLEGVPKNATVTVSTIPADRMGADAHKLRFDWDI